MIFTKMKAILIQIFHATIIFSSVACYGDNTVTKRRELFWRSANGQSLVFNNFFGENSKQLSSIKQSIERFSTYHYSVDSDIDLASLGERQILKSGFRTNSILPNIWKSKPMQDITKFLKNDQYKLKYSHDVVNLRLTRLEGRIIDTSDFNPVVTACQSNGPDLLVLVMLSKNWHKNDYGEVTIYSDDGEIEKSIYPKFGRVIILPCGTSYKINPPAFDDERRHHFLLAEYSSNPEVKVDKGVTYDPLGSSWYVEKKAKINLTSYETYDASKYLTSKFSNDLGEKIHVFDNAFAQEVVDVLKDYFWKHAQYTEVEIEPDSEDNVRWLLSIEETNFANGPVWFFLQRMVDVISEMNTFHPYDIACNNIRRGDNTITHQDCNDDEYEYTILTYLNPNITENNYGETAFFNGDDMFAAVKPIYGRTLIFNGNILHSARPLSTTYPGARYSYAVKTSKDKATALSKQARLATGEI